MCRSLLLYLAEGDHDNWGLNIFDPLLQMPQVIPRSCSKLYIRYDWWFEKASQPTGQPISWLYMIFPYNCRWLSGQLPDWPIWTISRNIYMIHIYTVYKADPSWFANTCRQAIWHLLMGIILKCCGICVQW